MRHNLAEAGHVKHEAFFQLEPPVRGDRLAERKEVNESPRAVLHPMRQARASEAEFRKSVLERLEIGEALNNDGHVRVVGHPRRASIQKQLWNKGTHDSEWDTELAQAALQIGHDRNQAALNTWHRREPWARAVRQLRAPVPFRDIAARRKRVGRVPLGVRRRQRRGSRADREAQ